MLYDLIKHRNIWYIKECLCKERDNMQLTFEVDGTKQTIKRTDGNQPAEEGYTPTYTLTDNKIVQGWKNAE